MRTTLAVVLAVLSSSCAPADTASPPEATTTASPASSTTSPATTTTSATPARRPVVLDYSPTVSDLGALAFLASHPTLELIGVTLPGTGESHCEPGVAHTRGVLTELGLEHVPVACGPEDPLTGWNAFPTSWRLAADEMDLPVAAPNETASAPDLIARLVGSAPEPVELVAVGPLTNVALALQGDASLAEGLAGMTIMGGAVDVPGNVFRNDVAEWNIWVDPTAAGIVLASGVPVTLVPLDATNHLPSGRVFWESLDAAARTPAAELVRDVWADNGDWIDNRDGFFYFWDELAAAVVVDESLVTFEERALVVDDAERDSKGWTREDADGSVVRVAVSADRRAFEQLFLDTLVGRSTELGYVTPTDDEIRYLEALAAIEATAADAFDAIFAASAEGVSGGVDEEEAFLQVVAIAVPSILGGPWSERVESLEDLDVPDRLRPTHDTYVSALREFAGSEAAVLEALDAGDFSAFATLFGPVAEACGQMQAEADARLVAVSLECADP